MHCIPIGYVLLYLLRVVEMYLGEAGIVRCCHIVGVEGAWAMLGPGWHGMLVFLELIDDIPWH
jgi:hypothetical protein